MIEQTWHPASEKPKDCGLYLTVVEMKITNKKKRYIDLLNYGIYNDGDLDKCKIGWYDYDREWGYVGYNEDVLYWMELPEMPKGEEQ